MSNIEKVIDDLNFFKGKLYNGIFGDKVGCFDEAISVLKKYQQKYAIKETEKGKIISEVLAERDRQDEKWGEQNHSAYVWGSIIGEEYGEMCKAINEFGFNPTLETEYEIYTEAIQTMASCMAMLECMQRRKNKVAR